MTEKSPNCRLSQENKADLGDYKIKFDDKTITGTLYNGKGDIVLKDITSVSYTQSPIVLFNTQNILNAKKGALSKQFGIGKIVQLWDGTYKYPYKGVLYYENENENIWKLVTIKNI